MILKVKTKWFKAAKFSKQRIADLDVWDGGNDERVTQVDHTRLTDAEFDALTVVARKAVEAKETESFALEQRLGTLRKLKEDVSGQKISSVKELEAALILFAKQLPNGWLFVDTGDAILPVLMQEAEYHEPRREEKAYTRLTYTWYELGKLRTDNVTWYTSDILGVIEQRPKLKDGEKRKSQRRGKTLPELLAQHDLVAETAAAIADYHRVIESYKGVSSDNYAQYTGENFGYSLNLKVGDDDERYGGGNRVHLKLDGVPRRLVIDEAVDVDNDAVDESEPRDNEANQAVCEILGDNTEAKGDDDEAFTAEARQAPLHPYVCAFDLLEHQFIKVLSSLVKPYVYDTTIEDSLILPADIKAATTMLIDGAARRFNDIIDGKSLGTFALSTGPAGTGKTLTAEVYAERLKRPLYKVQCSQLGTDEEELEKQLTPVLRRAQRWGAILLIDEADVYVRERGTDIQQNAIVGVFLRLLEYYRGIIFMTSNLDSIDDAIYSRATAHIRYALPDPELLAQIFGVQLKLAAIKHAVEPTALAKRFPGISGRTAKQLVRLATMWSTSTGADAVTLAHFDAIAKFQRV